MVPTRAFVFAVCAILVIVTVPTALAEERTFARLAFESPAEATARVSSTVEGEDAANLRQSIDAGGDGDGTVTQEEVDAFEEQFLAFFEEFGSEGDFAGSSFTMDGQPASSSGLDDLQIHDATGDADSTDPMTTELVMTFRWDVTAGDSHTLLVRGDGSADDDAPEQDVTFELVAPPGYRIGETRGVPAGSEFGADRRTLTMSQEPEADRDFEVTFEREGLGGAPGPGVLAVAAVAALVGVYLRRRVHL